MNRRLPLFFLALVIIGLPSVARAAQGVFWAAFRPDNSGLAFSSVYAVADHLDGRTWFGGTGLSVVGPRDDQWIRYTTANSQLPSDQVNDIAVGPDGRIWVATADGAASLSPDGSNWDVFNTRDGLPGNTILVIRVASNGDVWFGTTRGLAVRSARDGRFLTYRRVNSELPGDEVRDLVIAPRGDLWLATNGGVAVLRTGGAWEIYTRDGGFLPSDDVRGIARDSRGDIWAATWGGGVTRLSEDGRDRQILSRENSGLPDANLTGVEIGPDDLPWFGSASSGIFNYDPFRGSWQSYSASALGLTANAVTDLERGRGRSLWFGTLGGVAVYDPDGPRRPALPASPTPTATPHPTITPNPTETPRPTETPVPAGGAGPSEPVDRFEPNDRPESAFGPLTVGVAYPSYLTDSADRDYFWFDLPSPGRVNVRLRQIPPGSEYGLYLLDPNRRIVATSTAGENTQSIGYTTDRPGRYTVLVWSPVGDWSLARPYLLDLSIESGSQFRPAEVGTPGPGEAAATWAKEELAALGIEAGGIGEQPSPPFLRPGGDMAYALAPLQDASSEGVTRQVLATWLILRRAYPDAEWLTAIFSGYSRYLYYFFARADHFDAWWEFSVTDATFFNQSFYRVYDLEKRSWTDLKTFDNKEFAP